MGLDPGQLSTIAVYRRARRGERESVEVLLQRIRPRLEAWVAARLGPSLRRLLDVDDIVQECLLKAHRNIPSLELNERRALHAWLFAIARTTLIDWARRLRSGPRDLRRDEPLQSHLPSPEPTPSQTVSREEARERLLLALASLPERYRYIISLRRIEKLSTAETARRLGITPANARMLLTRARRALAEALGSDDLDGGPSRRPRG